MPVPVIVSVIDSDSEEPMSDVAVYLLNSNGQTTTLLGNTNSNGVIEITPSVFGQKIQFDFPGYDPLVIDPALISPYQRLKLVAGTGNDLAGVIVKGVRKITRKKNYALPIVLGSLSLLTFGVWVYKKYA